METKKLKLTQVTENERNPRMITDAKLQQLIDSLLVFPRMLELRPVVVDETNKALGGNMRLRALVMISEMDEDAIKGRLSALKGFQKKTDGEQDAILKYWAKWLKKPDVTVTLDNTLTEDEKKQFVIKDNVSFGAWDWGELSGWELEDLGEWGMDVWKPQDGDESVFNLPTELDGVDIDPDELPKYEGDDETDYQRIIVVYKPEEAEKLAALLGVEKIDKVVYKVEELIQ